MTNKYHQVDLYFLTLERAIAKCVDWFYVSLTQDSHVGRGNFNGESVSSRLACGSIFLTDD